LLKSVDCGRGVLTNELRQMLEEAAKIATANEKFEKEKFTLSRNQLPLQPKQS